MTSKNSETSHPHRLSLNPTIKIKIKIKINRSDKFVALSNLSISYTWRNIKNSQKNNKFEKSVVTWNEELELLDRAYVVSNV